MKMTAFVDIVVVGSCNIDYFFYTNKIPQRGETVNGNKFVIGYGGKGANQCVAAAKLGAQTALIARLGADVYGREYLNLLKELNVNTSHLLITDGVSSGAAQITVSEIDGDNRIVIVDGANGILSSEDVINAANIIKNAKVGLFQFEVKVSTTINAMKLFRNINNNAILMLNPSPVSEVIDPVIFELIDILVVNETEAGVITKQTVKSISDASIAAENLIKIGCKTAIVTLGSQGVVYAMLPTAKPRHVYVTPVDNPVDTTGAGDLFVGALAYAFIYKKDKNLEEQIKFACDVARECVTKPGAQESFPFGHNIENLLR